LKGKLNPNNLGYWAFLAGQRVVYFGRKGEQHIEEFPPTNP
jgi:hypothetical protein